MPRSRARRQVVGRHIIELVHPDDLERAAFDLDLYTDAGAVPGYSNYRVALADGSWGQFEAGSADVTVGGRPGLALYCRPDDRVSAKGPLCTDQGLRRAHHPLAATATPAPRCRPPRLPDRPREPQGFHRAAEVGISVGVAHSTGGFGDHLLEADRALYRANAGGGGAVASSG